MLLWYVYFISPPLDVYCSFVYVGIIALPAVLSYRSVFVIEFRITEEIRLLCFLTNIDVRMIIVLFEFSLSLR